MFQVLFIIFKKQKMKNNNTCKYKKDCLMHFSTLHKSILMSEISDIDAIILLNDKSLKEKDFEILPNGYKTKKEDKKDSK